MAELYQVRPLVSPNGPAGLGHEQYSLLIWINFALQVGAFRLPHTCGRLGGSDCPFRNAGLT